MKEVTKFIFISILKNNKSINPHNKSVRTRSAVWHWISALNVFNAQIKKKLKLPTLFSLNYSPIKETRCSDCWIGNTNDLKSTCTIAYRNCREWFTEKWQNICCWIATMCFIADIVFSLRKLNIRRLMIPGACTKAKHALGGLKELWSRKLNKLRQNFLWV